jgi:hypothetical protein
VQCFSGCKPASDFERRGCETIRNSCPSAALRPAIPEARPLRTRRRISGFGHSRKRVQFRASSARDTGGKRRLSPVSSIRCSATAAGCASGTGGSAGLRGARPAVRRPAGSKLSLGRSAGWPTKGGRSPYVVRVLVGICQLALGAVGPAGPTGSGALTSAAGRQGGSCRIQGGSGVPSVAPGAKVEAVGPESRRGSPTSVTAFGRTC